MNIKLVYAYDYPKEVYELFSEYTNMLIEGELDFKNYLDLQNYDAELKNLNLKYGLPYNRLYLAYYNDELAGCIGLIKIDESNCEMKRLYVKPHFRGKHIGDYLVEKIIQDAKNIGYSNMLLDTFPFLESAIYLYKKYGFYEVPSYNNSPMESLVYLKLDLS